MVFFITVLRALATCLITNSHYTGIYPADIIANGGLLGDILFFGVSGYCLCNIKTNFFKWYGKRIYRIYLPIITITWVFMLLGIYKYNYHNFAWWFIYPTDFHFAASIVVLYIPFFFVMKTDALRKRLPLIMGSVGLVFLCLYIFIYDKSIYHIDDVHSNYIRFLFFESMLLGAYFKINENKYKNRFSWYVPIITMITFFGYFASKLMFSKIKSLSTFQFANQIMIFVLLYFIFRLFASIDSKLENFPNGLKKVISFLAGITLEIYLVQLPIIDALRNVANFPLNWVLITASIILAAFVLHTFCNTFVKLTDKAINKITENKKGQ